MSRVPLTPSQTVGPFFHPAMLNTEVPQHVLIVPETEGERIRIEGRIFDGAGAPVPDALVEIWQANAYGRYNHPDDDSDAPLDPTFVGYARSETDEDGRYWFKTIRPGAVKFDRDRMQAPHVSLTIFGRGLLNHVFTRLYFADDPATASDPVLQYVPEERRATLLAQRASGEDTPSYTLDIILQGSGQTAFLNPTRAIAAR